MRNFCSGQTAFYSKDRSNCSLVEVMTPSFLVRPSFITNFSLFWWRGLDKTKNWSNSSFTIN